MQDTEHVANYPRPPRLEAVDVELEVAHDGVTLAKTTSAYRVLETYHPPTYYLPVVDFADGALVRVAGRSFCEWKGVAHYYDIAHGAHRLAKHGWGYDEPSPDFAPIAGHVALYASGLECFVGGERVVPQPGRFYGGWITSNLVGPFKGGPGTEGW